MNSEYEKLLEKCQIANTLIQENELDYAFFGKSTDEQDNITVDDFTFYGIKYADSSTYEQYLTRVDLHAIDLDNFDSRRITILAKYDANHATIVLKDYETDVEHHQLIGNSLVSEYNGELYFADEELIGGDHQGIFSKFMKETTGLTTWISHQENNPILD